MDSKIIPIDIVGVKAEEFAQCVDCPYHGVKNLFALDSKELGAWIGMMFAHRKINNRIAAQGSGVSESTIGRIRAGDIKDVRYSTLRHLIFYLLGASWGDCPCGKNSCAQPDERMTERVAQLEADGANMRAEIAARNAHIARIAEHHATELAIVRDDARQRVQFLNRLVMWLGIAAGALLVGLIGVLIFLFVIVL